MAESRESSREPLTQSIRRAEVASLGGLFLQLVFFAVLLRLFVVPVLYDTFARAAEWFRRTPGDESPATT